MERRGGEGGVGRYGGGGERGREGERGGGRGRERKWEEVGGDQRGGNGKGESFLAIHIVVVIV